MPARTRSDAQRNRAAILEAATRLFETSDAVSIAEVAEEAGLTRTTLYRHSRNLERVAARVVARDARWMITETLPPPYGPDFFATDRFHPSASGYADWASWAVEEAWPRGLSDIAYAGRPAAG